MAKIITLELSLPWFTVHALAFLPTLDKNAVIRSEWALCTHGYTSHKGDCLNWANRLIENGTPTIIFDQPGHYLGSFHEVQHWEDFRDHSHELFAEAFRRLEGLMEIHLGQGNYPKPKSLILIGHSLGAFNAIRATELPEFENLNPIAVAIGIGIGQRQGNHIFETAFYEKTISLRRQLVSPAIDSALMFPWLKEAKEELSISGKRVHMITGQDDVVVGPGGLEAMVEVLERNGNIVTWEAPKRLPHHEPGAATPHLFAFLKDQFGW